MGETTPVTFWGVGHVEDVGGESGNGGKE
jgi:hypothetical protein